MLTLSTVCPLPRSSRGTWSKRRDSPSMWHRGTIQAPAHTSQSSYMYMYMYMYTCTTCTLLARPTLLHIAVLVAIVDEEAHLQNLHCLEQAVRNNRLQELSKFYSIGVIRVSVPTNKCKATQTGRKRRVFTCTHVHMYMYVIRGRHRTNARAATMVLTSARIWLFQ